MPYYRENDFEQWLRTNGDKQASQTKGYITSLRNNFLVYYQLESIIDNLGIAICKKMETLECLRDLSNSAKKAVQLKKQYPHSSVLGQLKGSLNSLDAWASGLNRYIEFLDATEPNGTKCKTWGKQAWNTAIKKFNEDICSAVAKDGFTSIISKFNGLHDYIAFILENSYFFSSKDVSDRHAELLQMYTSNSILPARKSEKGSLQKISGGQLVFDDGTFCCPIEKDKDGNRFVRDLIEDKTGFTVSSGACCIFTNYKISHIWGNAFDPRYFTNIWNLVLIPAWANDMLDKNYDNAIIKKVNNTIKAVCCKQYKINGLAFNPFKMPVPSFDPAYVEPGNYAINELTNKKDKIIGKVVARKIKV